MIGVGVALLLLRTRGRPGSTLQLLDTLTADASRVLNAAIKRTTGLEPAIFGLGK